MRRPGLPDRPDRPARGLFPPGGCARLGSSGPETAMRLAPTISPILAPLLLAACAGAAGVDPVGVPLTMASAGIGDIVLAEDHLLLDDGTRLQVRRLARGVYALPSRPVRLPNGTDFCSGQPAGYLTLHRTADGLIAMNVGDWTAPPEPPRRTPCWPTAPARSSPIGRRADRGKHRPRAPARALRRVWRRVWRRAWRVSRRRPRPARRSPSPEPGAAARS